jgi:hypothetical protein
MAFTPDGGGCLMSVSFIVYGLFTRPAGGCNQSFDRERGQVLRIFDARHATMTPSLVHSENGR